MKFLGNICVIRENVRYVRRDGFRSSLKESTPVLLGKSLCSLAGEAPALWIALNPPNAERTVAALREFGFDLPELRPEVFLQEHKIIRLGRPPLRIEIATSISGVTFDDCYHARLEARLDGVEVNLISTSSTSSSINGLRVGTKISTTWRTCRNRTASARSSCRRRTAPTSRSCRRRSAAA